MNGYYTQEELGQFNFKSCGENVLISRKASLYATEQMSFGSNIRIDDFCFLVGRITLGSFIHLAPFVSIHGSGGGEVIMEDFSAVASQSSIYAGSDDYSGEVMTNPMVPEEYRKNISSCIVIKKHGILGVNCVLLPGAIVEEGVALGAMSLLAKPTEKWSIYVGVPAKKIRDRSKKCQELEIEFKGKMHI